MKQHFPKQTKPSTIAESLRAFADAVEAGQLSPDGQTEGKLKIRIQSDGDSWSMKSVLTVETPPSETAPDSGVKPKYKHLKKRMNKDFKSIIKFVSAGIMPDAELLTRFLADSDTMTTYPGKGDPHYPDYQAACRICRDGIARKHMPTVKNAVFELARLKGACHKRYK